MAGTSHPGLTTPTRLAVQPDNVIPYSTAVLGQAAGNMMFRQWTTTGRPYPTASLGLLTLAGASVADTQTDGLPSVATGAVGVTDDQLGAGADWYEDLHILPRTQIDFGNIITQVQDEYEIYNADRSASITLTTADTSAVDPGIDLPNLSLPEVIAAQCSALDPATTGNGGGLGLGSIVKLKVVAEQNGLPVFDGDILFSGSGDEVSLSVKGSRIVLLPMEYEAPVRETMAFLTDIIEALDGQEQRIALRKNPRQLFEVSYKLDGNDRQRMQALLMDWTANVFGFPLWHEKLRLSAAVSAGATVYQVATTADVDLRVGGLALVYTDANTFDVITIDAIGATTITAADPSQNAYPAGTAIMPLRAAQIVGAVPGVRYVNNVEELRIRLEVTDNNTGALTASTSGWSTYNSRVLFDDCNVMSGDQMPEQFSRRVYRIDNQTGKVNLSTTWDRNKRSHRKGFVLRNRADIRAFRRLMLALRGRQTSFYIPTFIEDLTPAASLGVGQDYIDIERIEYQRFIQSRFPKTIFRVTFTDGTSLIREVQSAAGLTATTERLTLDTTWPATRTVDEVVRIQFYELVRFDTDNVQLEYPRIGLAECSMPVVQVFDDN